MGWGVGTGGRELAKRSHQGQMPVGREKILGPMLPAEGKPGPVQQPQPGGLSTGIRTWGDTVPVSVLSQRWGQRSPASREMGERAAMEAACPGPVGI